MRCDVVRGEAPLEAKLVPWSAKVAGKAQLTFTRMLPEMLQEVLDLLPSYSNRIRLRAVCRATAQLEWRSAAPRRVDEELTGLGLGDVGVRGIAAGLRKAPNSALGELCLGSNGVGDAGAAAIAECLASPDSALRRLSLCNNHIGDVGAAALAAALAKNTMLEELDLWGNPISPEGRRLILASAKCEVFLTSGQVRRSEPFTPVNAKMRGILFDWIAQVHTGVSAPMALDVAPDPQEMLFQTFSHMDAYMALQPVARSDLQLVGVACTLTAAGLSTAAGSGEEMELASWLAFVTDGSYSAEDVAAAAGCVRQVLGFHLHQPTAYTFLRRYLRRTGWTEESFSLANYLLELAAVDSTFRAERPQTVAAAAAVLSRQYVAQGVNIRQMPRWKTKLLRCVQADLRHELAPCVAAMSRLHARQQPRQELFVNKKYEWARLHRVATLKPNAPMDAAYFERYMRFD